jgi:two-component system sensor histidine kinase MprB
LSFRARLTISAAAAVALAVVLAAPLVYVIVRGELMRPIDDGLKQSAVQIARLPPDGIDRAFYGHGPGPRLSGSVVYPQLVDSTGKVYPAHDDTVGIPVDARVRSVAKGTHGPYLSDAHIGQTHVRVATYPYALIDGVAVQVARPLTEVDDALARIRTFLILVAAGGIALAAALGLGVSRAALAPVRRLTKATETVAETGDLSERIEVSGGDELSRLAVRFNTMLAALEDSARAQRQLVADASHELRTPLTSLRTNIEVLARHELPVEERERVLSDVIEQLTEMTALIAELVELARGDAQALEPEDLRLDLLVADAVVRAQRNAPNVDFRLDADESLVHGVPSRIERAVGNLLDNAGKWSPKGSVVQVTVRDGEVTVRDRGPGIAEEDLPFVFDRFYRAPSARGMPGSGLGLSIVQQVATAHGGLVTAEHAEEGGALMRLRLPPV